MSHFQVEKKMSNNVNKALVIDYSDSRLISCGSLFQGNTNKNFAPLNFFAPLLHFFYTTASDFFPIAPHAEEFFPGHGKRNWVRTDLSVMASSSLSPLHLLAGLCAHFVPTLCPHLACAELQKCTHAAPNVLELATRGKPELSHPLQWFPAILTSQLYTKLEIN